MMKTDLPMKSSTSKDDLKELDKKEKIRQLENKILSNDNTLIRVLKDMINKDK